MARDRHVQLAFSNNGSQEHPRYAVSAENASSGGTSTNASDAIFQLGPVEPGETVDAIEEIPAGTEALYLFCSIEDHELRGMNATQPVQAPEDRPQEPENGGTDEVPAPSIDGVVAALAVALGFGRSRIGEP